MDRKNPPQGPTHYSRVWAVAFACRGTAENELDSTVTVTSKNLFHGVLPVNGGVYSPHMGTTDHSWLCHTCGEAYAICPGHSGSFKLRYPVKSPLFRNDMLKWLHVACHACGQYIGERIPKVPPMDILTESVHIARRAEKCPHCGHVVVAVKRDKLESTVFYYNATDTKPRQELFNHKISEIFARIPDDFVIAMGKPLRSHPSKFILWTINVPPNTIRPDIKRIGSGNRSNNNDLTTTIRRIVEQNELIPEVIADDGQISDVARRKYVLLDVLYDNMIRGSGSAKQLHFVANTGKNMVSIADRITKKSGRVRRNLMGKRVVYMGRSVITGDANIQVNEIGVPITIAREIDIPETFSTYNYARLMTYYMNRNMKYPGCIKLQKIADGKIYRIDKLPENYVPQIGDVIYRHLINGDVMGFNRQPTLEHGSIMCHRVVVLEVGDTFRMNLSATTPYNADFDGDEMNTIIGQSIQSRVEIGILSLVNNFMIDPATSSPWLGLIQDGIIGIEQFTHAGKRFLKYHAMAMFASITAEGINRVFDAREYTNYDIISRILPPINVVNKTPTVYREQYAAWLNYDPRDIRINIERGRHISGVLDKATLGTGVAGSIFHVINNEHGSKKALDTIYAFQQIANNWFYHSGYTVGIRDVVVRNDTLVAIKAKIMEMIIRSRAITKKLDDGKLIPPIGTSLRDYYERLQLDVINAVEGFILPLLPDMNFRINKLAHLIYCGSKGNEVNYAGINGALRYALTNGQRSPRNAGWGRTGPYWPRYSMEPTSLGFVPYSYVEGVGSDSFSATCAEARFAAITNALTTSVTGEQSRTSGKNLESIHVNNLRQSVKEMHIVQMLYADNGLNPRSLENIKLNHVTISDEEFRTKFYGRTVDFINNAPAAMSKTVQTELDAEFERLTLDRKYYRDVVLRIEASSPRGFMFGETARLPVNLQRVIEDTVNNYVDMVAEIPESKRTLDPVRAITVVRKLCDELPYVFMNEYCRAEHTHVPEHLVAACTLMRIAIRSYLCTRRLKAAGVIDCLLDIIVRQIWATYKRSLIAYGTAVGLLAAQCVSAMATQTMLDSKHTAGKGGQKTTGMSRTKEILRARTTQNLKGVSMLIMCKSEYESSRAHVQNIANHIEMITLSRFVTSVHVFFEAYGKPTHPEFVAEASIIHDITKLNAGRRLPNDISNWCVRFALDKEQLIMKSMKIETIVLSLQRQFPGVYVIATPENYPRLFLRCYIRGSMFRAHVTEHTLHEIRRNLTNCIIRGVDGIITADVVDVLTSYRDTDGSMKTKKVFAISTEGTNLAEILNNPYVDGYRTQSSSITEIESVFGIVAARNKIMSEMKATNDKISPMHSGLYADEMTFPGTVTSIGLSGLETRDRDNVNLRLSYQSQMPVLAGAGSDGLVSMVGGVSGPLMVGSIPAIGTLYNKIVVNEEFVRTLSSVDEQIDAL